VSKVLVVIKVVIICNLCRRVDRVMIIIKRYFSKVMSEDSDIINWVLGLVQKLGYLVLGCARDLIPRINCLMMGTLIVIFGKEGIWSE
jgi:hypothetical protein